MSGTPRPARRSGARRGPRRRKGRRRPPRRACRGGGGHEHDPVPGLGGECERAAGRDRLVVGVGVEGDDRVRHGSHPRGAVGPASRGAWSLPGPDVRVRKLAVGAGGSDAEPVVRADARAPRRGSWSSGRWAAWRVLPIPPPPPCHPVGGRRSTNPASRDTEIRVTAVTSITNPTNVPYSDIFNGVKAYFDMVNGRGAIYGRKLVLPSSSTTTSSPTTSVTSRRCSTRTSRVRGGPRSRRSSASPAPSCSQGRPPDVRMEHPARLDRSPQLLRPLRCAVFRRRGSPADPTLPWIVEQLHENPHRRPRVQRREQSATSVSTWSRSQLRAVPEPAERSCTSTGSLSFGVTDFSGDVNKMKDAKVDFVTTCLDTNGVLALATGARGRPRRDPVPAERLRPGGS